MSECTGNPNSCGFCGTGEAKAHTGDHCAKTECKGCTADPGSCDACQGCGCCVSTECTGNPKTCKACQSGGLDSCRKEALNATEGVERARPVA